MAPRVVITFPVGAPVTAWIVGVHSPEDRARLLAELGDRETVQEIKTALGRLWDDLQAGREIAR